MEYKLNLLPSPNDNRDFIFKKENIVRTETTYPNKLDLRKELMPVRNQGVQGTCYAQSACCMKEWQEKQNYEFNEYFSPQFFYNLRSNKYDNDNSNDEGMFGRDVMKLLKTYGICAERMYPYGLIEHKDNISEEIYKAAKINIIHAYAKINTINDLKMSLYLNGPALVGFPVYNYTGQMWKQKNNETFKGGHAMTIVGYNEEGFLIRNSWGESWNDKGYTIYYYEDWGAHWEIWSCVDKKDIIPVEDKENDKDKEKDKEKDNEEQRDQVDEQEDDEEDTNVEDVQESFCEKLYKHFF